MIANIQQLPKSQPSKNSNQDLNQPLALLGNLSVAQFMQDYWQKKPLLIKQAMPNFIDAITKDAFLQVAKSSDLPTRLISASTCKTSKKTTWQMQHGFSKTPTLKSKEAQTHELRWTVLVQHIHLHNPNLGKILQAFNFLPYARLDDLMISYAIDGAGIGAHVDSYDVFLFQGSGKRQWEIAKQEDLSLQEDAPLKLLKQFKAQETYILEPGDMLYLPPNYAHCGTAIGECMTYSIGFRAPKSDELGYEYLMDSIAYAEEVGLSSQLYTDEMAKGTATPAKIPDTLIAFMQKIIDELPKMPANVLLGKYLTRTNEYLEAFNEKHEKILANQRKAQKIKSLEIFTDVLLNAKSIYQAIILNKQCNVLYDEDNFYINGEVFVLEPSLKKFIEQLANQKLLNLSVFQTNFNADDAPNKAILENLYALYQQDYLSLI